MFEVVAYRDPDGPTTLAFFRDGVEVYPADAGITVYDVDPGASGGDKEWRTSMAEIAKDASPIVRDLIAELSE